MSSAYLRVVVTQSCPLRCGFCHAEGLREDERGPAADAERLALRVLGHIDAGVRKVKFLGGEPLSAPTLAPAIRLIRQGAPDGIDLSIITSGAASVHRLAACFEAGLDRANLSIHGFTEDAFAARAKVPKAYPLRQACFEYLLSAGRPVKLNYVYQGPRDDSDLAGLLDFVAGRGAVVGLLNDLNDPSLDAGVLETVLTTLRGPAARAWAEPDPYSLPTRRLAWDDGLIVELKDHQLGAVAPWRFCQTCPKRGICREGIDALRLDPDGRIRPCMDRPELGVSVASLSSRAAVETAVRTFLSEARAS